MLVNNVGHAHKHMHVHTPTHSHLSQNSTSHHKCEFLTTTANEHLTPVPSPQSHLGLSAAYRAFELGNYFHTTCHVTWDSAGGYVYRGDRGGHPEPAYRQSRDVDQKTARASSWLAPGDVSMVTVTSPPPGPFDLSECGVEAMEGGWRDNLHVSNQTLCSPVECRSMSVVGCLTNLTWTQSALCWEPFCEDTPVY